MNTIDKINNILKEANELNFSQKQLDKIKKQLGKEKHTESFKDDFDDFLKLSPRRRFDVLVKLGLEKQPIEKVISQVISRYYGRDK